MFVAHFENTMRNAKFAEPKAIVEQRQQPHAYATVAEFRMLSRRIEAIEAALLLAGSEKKPFAIDYNTIARRMCLVFGVKKVHIMSNRRGRHLVFARQAIMYWAYRLTDRSLPEIGRLMGGRDHTTVLHGYHAYVAKRAAMGRTLRPLDQRQGPAR